MSHQILNSENLLSLIERFVKKTSKLPPLFFKDIEWRVENCSGQEVLFYKLGPSPEDEQKLLNRLKINTPALLILNRQPQGSEYPPFIVIKEEDFLNAQEILLDIWWPLKQLIEKHNKKLVGITGTNGKTTTVHLCVHLADQLGIKAFSIGTLGIRNGQGVLGETYTLTTPPLIELRKCLYKHFLDHDICFMEVSSHALEQERVRGLIFDTGAWTSFTQDHLDFHKSIDNYFKAKCLLLEKHLKKGAPLFVPKEQSELKERLKKYKNVITPPSLEDLAIKNLPKFFNAQFNRNNLELSLAILKHLVGTYDKFNFHELPLPDGRFSVYDFAGKTIIIDSAHTPDALRNICQAIKEGFPNKSLWVLFGCGGDRDPIKRPLMAKVVSEFADRIYLTSDNPRNEDPHKILKEVSVGLDLKKTIQNVNRDQAAYLAFKEMNKDVVLLMAGKGHENYQIIKGVKHPYSDLSAIHQAFTALQEEKND